MPPMGVADVLLREVEPNSVERFWFWLHTHTLWNGEALWRTTVLRECLPEDVGDFTAGMLVSG